MFPQVVIRFVGGALTSFSSLFRTAVVQSMAISAVGTASSSVAGASSAVAAIATTTSATATASVGTSATAVSKIE